MTVQQFLTQLPKEYKLIRFDMMGPELMYTKERKKISRDLLKREVYAHCPLKDGRYHIIIKGR